MHPDYLFTRALIAHGWGRSWGVFLRTQATAEIVRRHLRSLLRVRLYDGRPMLFRFYDPRVLRCYLPTCTAAELAEVFGPIDSFVMENRDAEAALVFARAESGLDEARVALTGLAGPSRPFGVTRVRRGPQP
jgi:hypothetical protein